MLKMKSERNHLHKSMHMIAYFSLTVTVCMVTGFIVGFFVFVLTDSQTQALSSTIAGNNRKSEPLKNCHFGLKSILNIDNRMNKSLKKNSKNV
jgi:hypothetical protein